MNRRPADGRSGAGRGRVDTAVDGDGRRAPTPAQRQAGERRHALRRIARPADRRRRRGRRARRAGAQRRAPGRRGGGAGRRRPTRERASWSTGTGGSRPTRSWSAAPPQEMVAAAGRHRELAEQRVPGRAEAAPRPRRPTSTTRSIEIVTDDMPFLVDSVTAALTARDLDVHLLVHPLVVVRREPLGELAEVARRRRARRRRSPATSSRAGCASRSTAVRDPRRPRAAPQATCSGCSPTCARRSRTGRRCAPGRWRSPTSWPSAELPVPDKDITDSVELLRWLADDHFTFLGYREYRARARATARSCCEAVPGTGLGILRGDQTDAARAVAR